MLHSYPSQCLEETTASRQVGQSIVMIEGNNSGIVAVNLTLAALPPLLCDAKFYFAIQLIDRRTAKIRVLDWLYIKQIICHVSSIAPMPPRVLQPVHDN